MEVLGIIIGIIGLIIAYIALRKDHYSKPKDELEALQVQWMSNKTLSEKTQHELRQFIDRYNAWDADMYPGMTYRYMLGEMERVYNIEYTDTEYKKLSEMCTTKPLIEIAMKNLNVQYS